MKEFPELDGWDAAAVAGVVLVLIVAYVVVPHTVVQYGAWLVVFTIWMAWFVYFVTKWLYGVES